MTKNSEPHQKKAGLARSRQNLNKGVVVEWMAESKPESTLWSSLWATEAARKRAWEGGTAPANEKRTLNWETRWAPSNDLKKAELEKNLNCEG